jgi:hypothetical protein
MGVLSVTQQIACYADQRLRLCDNDVNAAYARGKRSNQMLVLLSCGGHTSVVVVDITIVHTGQQQFVALVARTELVP